MPYEVEGGVVVASSLSCNDCPYFKKSKKKQLSNNPLCQFDKPINGGFKGTRPHYIKYRIICDAVEQHGAKEDFMTCRNWTENMQRRAAFGIEQRAQGKDGEILKIVGQEGDPIELRTNVEVNTLGEIVKPNAELARRLEADGRYKIAPDSRAHAVENREIVYKTVVPNFEEEQKRMRGYSDGILRREMEEQNLHDSADEEAWKIARARLDKSNALPATPQVATAEPLKRGPGRPPNPKPESTNEPT